MNERQGLRPETIERDLPPFVQPYIWDATVRFTEALIPTATLDTLVDYIRAVNLRAANAIEFNQPEWRDRLYKVKYKLLIRAAEMRKQGQNIQIESNIIEDRWGYKLQKLTFTIGTKPKPFKTDSYFSNLRRVLKEDDLVELLEPFDLPKEVTKNPNETQGLAAA